MWPTFLFEDHRHNIWMVVSDGHVQWGLHRYIAVIIRQRFLGLQVGVSSLLEQLCGQARQTTATRSVKRTLTLKSQLKPSPQEKVLK